MREKISALPALSAVEVMQARVTTRNRKAAQKIEEGLL